MCSTLNSASFTEVPFKNLVTCQLARKNQMPCKRFYSFSPLLYLSINEAFIHKMLASKHKRSKALLLAQPTDQFWCLSAQKKEARWEPTCPTWSTMLIHHHHTHHLTFSPSIPLLNGRLTLMPPKKLTSWYIICNCNYNH